MPTSLLIYALLMLAILLAFLGIVLLNLRTLPTITSYPPTTDSKDAPTVAILLPARNEEANIEACLLSLLAQDYPNLQIWLYDDASTDRTREIANLVSAEYALRTTHYALRIIAGTDDPPPGWLGKANACHQIYTAMRAEANPDYILFTDADVRFMSEAVSHALTTAKAYNAGLLSIFPRQTTVGWAERLAVPVLLHWTAYNFLPLPLAFTQRAGPAFAAANGQFMLFTREAYEACGGHNAVRSEILEDVALARAVKRAGYKALLADGGPLVRTRMYEGAGEVWRGYSKNAYAFFGYSPLFLALGVIALFALYVAPPILAGIAFIYGQPTIALIFLAQYLVAVLIRLVLAVRFAYRPMDTLLHPVAVLYMIAIQLNSLVWRLTGKGVWKGRATSGRPKGL